MVRDMKPCHQFVVSNDAGVVIRCCVHCGLSHQMGRPGKLIWELILEEKGDETFTKPCPGENGSDDLFPYHHFVLSNHYSRQWGNAVVIRFCVRCGLSHLLDAITQRDLGVQVLYPLMMPTSVPCWRRINEDERDMTVSDLCSVEQGCDALERRYLLVPKN